MPSFEDLIVRTKRGGRALEAEEQKKVLAVYAPWMRRLAEFAKETGPSEGDLLRLTDEMINREDGVIVPTGGRKKTDVEQVSPLTARARTILDEIKAERWSRAVVPLNGLVFTREDGRRITKDMIHAQIEKAIKATGVKKFTFHNYRNTALTEWARRGIHVDVAMKASGVHRFRCTSGLSIYRRMMLLTHSGPLRTRKLLRELLHKMGKALPGVCKCLKSLSEGWVSG